MKQAIVVWLVVILSGCTGAKQSTSERAPTFEDDIRKYEAEFRPSDWDPIGRTDQPQARKDSTGVSGTPIEQSTQYSTELVPGYRVQLFSSRDIDEAKAKKSEFETLIPSEWFYLEFDPPTYKVRAGNFLTRFDAERFVKMLLEKRNTDAWVVPQKVYKQPPPPPPPQESVDAP